MSETTKIAQLYMMSTDDKGGFSQKIFDEIFQAGWPKDLWMIDKPLKD